ncbi:MAG: EamA family transporter [bacterium]|nr:EamA family transporter [bacterium]
MIVEDWFIHSLIGVTAVGVTMALFKVPTTKGHNKFIYSFFGFVAASILSFIFLRSYISIDSSAMLFGFGWGSLYALIVLFQMEILKKLDTNAVFPITTTSSNVLVLIIGLIVFHDKLSLPQFLGVLLAFFTVGFYNQIHKHITFNNGLLFGASAIVLLSTLAKFIQKFGSISVEIENFIFWQLFFAMLTSAIILVFISKKDTDWKNGFSKYIIVWAIALGTTTFIGTVEIVKALSTGPFSLVFIINSFYILITSLITWKFFGEELTKHKIIFLFIAIIAVIFMGLK